VKGETALDGKDLEIARLRRGLNDVVGLLGLSATWTQAGLADIARTLGQALFVVLALDFVVVDLAGDDAVVQIRPGFQIAEPGQLRAILRRTLGEEPGAWPAASRHLFEGGEVSLATIRLGLERAFGTIVAGTARPDFPGETERLILSVAGNQALVALQEARLQREQQARAGEASATALIEGIPGFVAMLAPDGRVQRVNRQIEDYCGQPLDELQHWGTNGIVHPDDMPHVAQVFGTSIASGIPYNLEQRLRRFDGAYRWFENRGRPHRDEHGAIVAWHVLLTDVDDRRRAEEAVRASETNLRRQSETFPQMLWSATADGSIDYCNERLLAYSGLAAGDVNDGGWVNLLHPDDREPTAKIWMDCVATGGPYSVEVRHYNKAARAHRWNLTTALPLRDGEGRIVKWYGSCVDIHDRKLAEQALKASERHLAQIVETIPQNLFGAGADGLVNYINPQMRDWFGRADDTIMAEEWVNLVHPDDREGTIVAWMGAVEAGTPYRHEVRFLHRSGEYRWCDGKAQPLQDADGIIIAWHGVVNDIHDRKLVEEDLAARERTLREAHDHLSQAQRLSQTGSFTTDVLADTHIWSDELYRILEYGREEVPTFVAFRNRIHPEDVSGFDAGFKRAMKGQTEFDELFRIVTPRGNTKHLHAVAHFMPGSEERPIVIGSIQDITEGKRAEEALDRARSELAHVTRVMSLGALTASIAHEVNQPLAGIITNASTCLRMLAEEPPNVGGAVETARRTIRDGNRAAEVIKRLRALFRRQEFVAEALDLNEATQEVITLSAQDLQRRGLSVQPKFDEALPPVSGDRVQLQQVILNLVLNAADAMDDVEGRPRQIVVETGRTATGLAKLTVRDTGRGIAPDDLGKVFEAFYTTKADGMGIGLAVSRSIIERHEGRLWACSGDGPGTAVSFSVPCMIADEGAASIPQAD
jgi:PAS domain S-box-containing protein